MPDPTTLSFRPLTPDLWSDFEHLFGPRGACAGCWCTFWRDHCEFLHEFTNAKIYVQKADLEAALNPHPIYKTRYYPREYYVKVKWEVIEGDKKIVDGVEVLLTPGHTPGCQSVAVDTKAGRAIITGFCCLEQNMFPPPQVAKLQEVIPTTIVYDAMQCYDSMLRVKDLADIVITTHASKYMFVDRIPA